MEEFGVVNCHRFRGMQRYARHNVLLIFLFYAFQVSVLLFVQCIPLPLIIINYPFLELEYTASITHHPFPVGFTSVQV